MEELFFSIIIPAHNEEKYIKVLLRSIKKLSYPISKFEVIIVENGSNDKTFIEAKKFRGKSVRVFSIKKRGISLAKNYGASKANKKADWLIFLDADTLVKKIFLSSINSYLNSNNLKSLSIGTTMVSPIEKGPAMNVWFRYYDNVHRFLKMSASIQIVRKKFFNLARYDENLEQQEDMSLIKNMLNLGKFFYISKNIVSASTRRFKKVGGFRLSLMWIFSGLLPYKIKTKSHYEIIR